MARQKVNGLHALSIQSSNAVGPGKAMYVLHSHQTKTTGGPLARQLAQHLGKGTASATHTGAHTLPVQGHGCGILQPFANDQQGPNRACCRQTAVTGSNTPAAVRAQTPQCMPACCGFPFKHLLNASGSKPTAQALCSNLDSLLRWHLAGGHGGLAHGALGPCSWVHWHYGQCAATRYSSTNNLCSYLHRFHYPHPTQGSRFQCLHTLQGNAP